jgi:hypothetical protein
MGTVPPPPTLLVRVDYSYGGGTRLLEGHIVFNEMSQECVYACVCAHTRVVFFLRLPETSNSCHQFGVVVWKLAF